MKRLTAVVTALAIGLLPRSSLAVGRHDIPRVVPGPQVVYRCAGGRELVVSYFTLSDGSLDFVRLRLPEGQRSTLPRLVAASGVRYSDEARFQWWTKGAGGFLQERSAEGQWRMALRDCRSLPPQDALSFSCSTSLRNSQKRYSGDL
jgi:membrane-bound inhibitor of C-type lysozyme